MTIDSGARRTFFGKIVDLITAEASSVNPRQAPDLVRDLVATLSKLIEAAPKEHRDGLRGRAVRPLRFKETRCHSPPI
jgi:hypothetical protein